MKTFPLMVVSVVALLVTADEELDQRGSKSLRKHILEELDYDKTIRPHEVEGQPINVTVDLTITAVTYIDELNMDYSLDMYFRSHWVDPRLRRNTSSSVLLGYQFNDVIWMPDLFFPNEKTGSSHDMVVPNQYLRIYPNGSILMSKRIAAKFSCYMDIRMYPVDNQTCSLLIESYGHMKNELDLFWKTEHPVDLSSDIRVTEFSITHVTHSICDRVLPTGVFPCLRARLYFRRMSGVYLLNAYLPAVLVVIMSWVAFWLDVNAVAARVSIGLLTVLTMTTQTTSVISDLPRVAYIKAIEIWMCGCLLFVFIAFLESAAAFVSDGLSMSRSSAIVAGTKVKDGEIAVKVKKIGDLIVSGQESNGSLSYPIQDANFGEVYKGLHSRSSLYEDSLSSWGSRDLLQKTNDHRSQKICLETSPQTIDKVSRILFPVTFFMFNASYWMVCYML